MRKLYFYLLAFFIFSLLNNCSRNTTLVSSDYLGESGPTNTPLVFAPGLVSKKGRFEMGLTISPNGKSIAYGTAHESDPTQTNIHIMHLTKGGWISRETADFPDNQNVFFPMFGPNGDQLYFSKFIEGKDNDLWVGEYANGLVTNTHPLDPVINSRSREAGHGVLKDGTIYFTSNRDDTNACCGDVYTSSPEGSVYRQVEKVAALNSPVDEESLYLDPEGRFIIVQSWKQEYGSKHDLYISYKTKTGRWTQPSRLSEAINGPEIEQRPFVSADDKYLFFSRMSIEQNGDETRYESDIYWVNTQLVFKPFVFNPVNTFRVDQSGQFNLALPQDLFKHIEDDQLSYSVSLVNDSPLPAWINFDNTALRLSGNWNSQRSLAIKITASDTQGQTTSTQIEILGPGSSR